MLNAKTVSYSHKDSLASATAGSLSKLNFVNVCILMIERRNSLPNKKTAFSECYHSKCTYFSFSLICICA